MRPHALAFATVISIATISAQGRAADSTPPTATSPVTQTPPADQSAAKPPELDHSMCLQLPQIVKFHAVSENAIGFEMLGGTYWLNIMPKKCLTLKRRVNILQYGSANVCADQTFVEVAETGVQCKLGGFVRYVPPKKSQD